MPLIEVKLYDRRVNPDACEKIIKEMTDGLCRVIGEEMREGIWVIVEGVPPTSWGIGGKAGS